MLEIQKIRQDTQSVIQALEAKKVKNAGEMVEQIITSDAQRRELLTELEQNRAEMQAMQNDSDSFLWWLGRSTEKASSS